METLGPQDRDTSRDYGLELASAALDNDTGAPASLLGVFDGSETFRATLREGDGLVVLADLPCVWDASLAGNPATVDTPRLRLSVPSSAVIGLAGGYYRVKVVLAPGVRDVEVWSGALRLGGSAGVAIAGRTYCDLADVVALAPWAETAEDLGEGLRAGYMANFLAERVRAADWVDTIVLSRLEMRLRDWGGRWGGRPRWFPTNLGATVANGVILPASWSYGWSGGESDGGELFGMELARQLLADGGLILDGLTRRLAATYTLWLALRAVPGSPFGDKGTPYSDLAAGFKGDANRVSREWDALLDVADPITGLRDGLADLRLGY